MSGEDGDREVLEEILQEIDKMGYPSVGSGCGLEDAGITDRYEAAAYGFQEAKDRIVEIIRSHSNDGWIYCGDGNNLPEEHLCSMHSGSPEDESQLIYYTGSELVQVTVHDADADETYVSDDCLYNGEWSNFCGGRYEVLAWQPLPSPYNPQKSVGEDYKQRVMERFLKVE